jgi:hypothetical protein
MSYYFAALSTRKNLELCKEYATAGFPETWSGLWAYMDIQIGDYLSFLYGARAHNLYQIVDKEAIENPEKVPPDWEPVETKKGKLYFPYRLYLQQIGEFTAPLAREDFLYITENLLRRGGIRKSHFQADEITLQNVKKRWANQSLTKSYKRAGVKYETFTPLFVGNKGAEKPPKVNMLREEFIHSILRLHLSRPKILKDFLKELNIPLDDTQWEVLGERALERGYVDLLIKEIKSEGEPKEVVIEVKRDTASVADLKQLQEYMEEIGESCIAGVIIANKISRKLVRQTTDEKFHFYRYYFDLDLSQPRQFDEIRSRIFIEKLSR